MNNSGLRCSCSNNAGTNLADEKTFSIVKGEIRELIDVAWNHKRHTEADEILVIKMINEYSPSTLLNHFVDPLPRGNHGTIQPI